MPASHPAVLVRCTFKFSKQHEMWRSVTKCHEVRKRPTCTLAITNRWLLDFQFLFKTDVFSALSLLDLMSDFGPGHKSEKQRDRGLLSLAYFFPPLVNIRFFMQLKQYIESFFSTFSLRALSWLFRSSNPDTFLMVCLSFQCDLKSALNVQRVRGVGFYKTRLKDIDVSSHDSKLEPTTRNV